MGEIFPAGDELAEWIATVAIAVNDFSFASDQVTSQEQAGEWIYSLRVAVSHFTEAGKYLESTASLPAVAAFLANLPRGAAEYELVLDTYQRNKSKLHAIRDVAAFHYPAWRDSPRRPMKRGVRRGSVATRPRSYARQPSDGCSCIPARELRGLVRCPRISQPAPASDQRGCGRGSEESPPSCRARCANAVEIRSAPSASSSVADHRPDRLDIRRAADLTAAAAVGAADRSGDRRRNGAWSHWLGRGVDAERVAR